MRNFILSLFLFSISFLHSTESSEPYRFTIYQRDYLLSKKFDLEKQNIQNQPIPFGIVSKPKVSIRSNYQLFDTKGLFEAQGLSDLLSLGALKTWATDIKVYDYEGKYIGMIDGQMVINSRAQFSFYDKDDSRVAIALVESEGMSVHISLPSYNNVAVASLKRVDIARLTDHWEVSVYDPAQIDLRVLKIFSSFIADYQNKWLPDDDDDD